MSSANGWTTRKAPEDLAILYIGTRSGTTLQRARALTALGHTVVSIPSSYPRHWRLPAYLDAIYLLYHAVDRIRPSPDFYATNRRAIRRRLGNGGRCTTSWSVAPERRITSPPPR